MIIRLWSDLKAGKLIARFFERLAVHPHFKHRCQWTHLEFDGERLVISGNLPSFYLKQLLQEALRDLQIPIANRIKVVCCEGFISDE